MGRGADRTPASRTSRQPERPDRVWTDARRRPIDRLSPSPGKRPIVFDIKWIRDNPAAFDAGLAKRGLAPLSAELIALDEARRTHVTKLQEAQARRNCGLQGDRQGQGGQGRGQGERADGRGGRAEGRARQGRGSGTRAGRQAARCAVGHPQPAARRRAGRQGREGQQGGAPRRRAAEARRHQQAASSTSRSARRWA